ncbi:MULTISPECIES: AraC family transcriptional regulator [unclassified Leeuwenhoekiella]|uniref:AraC family transcriptional regulator n=1 Tax=unclassified Leeuwenhoekiella TaxID=2615029 RepID=UPI000C3E196E|nr:MULTISPECIES: AraC family transcriptional regulator [unclassified Leeuwenhoekiella]MBA82488.1 AraC family transcriptional regulator [Leeuwenhoekiella sp.]
MKVLPFKIPKSGKQALIIQEDHEFLFYDKLHQHPEIQMSYVLSGTGTLLTGNTVTRFDPGEVLVFGGNLPHVFRSDIQEEDESHMLSVFFSRESFGADFFETEELRDFENFFNLAQSGFRVKDKNLIFKKYFLQLKDSDGKRFLHFINLLYETAEVPKELLSNFTENSRYTDTEGQRMSKVFDFCLNHFQERIGLEEIADVAVMSPTAFCRFFKERTNKTFSEFLTGLRIEHACQLLRTPDQPEPIANIAYAAGFNSVSNFNRYFKKEKGISPREYKKLIS